MSIFRTTRGRIVLIAVAIFAVALLLADGIVLASVTISQSQQADAVLVAQANLLASNTQEANGQISFDETTGGVAVDAAIVSGSTVTSQTANQPLPPDVLLNLASRAVASGGPVFADVTDTHHVPRRAYAIPITGGNTPEAIVVSRSVAEMLETQWQALVSLVLVSVVLLIMGGGLAYWLAGRALRPVRTIAGTARSISEHDLHRRVDVKAPPDELGELVDTFNAMLDRLEAGFQSMGRFTADASHELRAPLALMRSEVEGTLSRARTKEEYRRALESVQGEVEHLSRVADQLLILARADAGALVPAKENVDVADFLHETAARWEATAEARGARIEVSAPASGYVEADPALLRRVVDNLVDNAVRHTNAGTAVAVRAYSANGGWNVEVADHGPGIPPEFRGRVFSRFARQDTARTPEDGGAGLGLALSEAIARAHGGNLSLADDVEEGAVFRLYLPRSAAA
jgi:two-component system OmpR family sensor kinase